MEYDILNGFVYFSKAAYESGQQQLDTIQQGIQKSGLQLSSKPTHFYNKSKGLYAFGLKGNDVVLISFRGTTPSFSEMWNGFVKTGMNDQGYEDGMYKQYTWLKESSSWDTFIEGFSRVYFTGHSLGAAMSMFATIDYGQQHLTTTINYACPRLGDKRYQEKIDKFDNVYRVVHSQDPVPHSPGTIFGFVHGGREINVSYMEECKQKGVSSLASGNYTSFLMFGMLALLLILVFWVIIRGSIALARLAKHRKLHEKDIGIVYGLFGGVLVLVAIVMGLYYAYYSHGVNKYLGLISNHGGFGILPVTCRGKHWGSVLGPWVVFFILGSIFFIALGYKNNMGASKIFVLFTLVAIWALSLVISIVQAF